MYKYCKAICHKYFAGPMIECLGPGTRVTLKGTWGGARPAEGNCSCLLALGTCGADGDASPVPRHLLAVGAWCVDEGRSCLSFFLFFFELKLGKISTQFKLREEAHQGEQVFCVPPCSVPHPSPPWLPPDPAFLPLLPWPGFQGRTGEGESGTWPAQMSPHLPVRLPFKFKGRLLCWNTEWTLAVWASMGDTW